MKVLQWTVLTLCLCGCKWVVSVHLTAPITSVKTETPPPVTPTVDESARLVDWLMKYGYLPPPDPSTGQLQSWTAVTHALKAMQRFAGLHDSGALDKETLKLMQTPRCSLPDDDRTQIPHSDSDSDTELRGQRVKRAVSSWAQRNINWRLRTYPNSSALAHEMFRSLVFYALKVWSEPTALEFHEVGGPDGADLLIDFLNGLHGDGYPFDGVGGAVGHAFFPSDPERAGEVHLDAEEQWAFRQPASEGTDVFTVLVHELGHALGLSHSSARGSVMRPYYQGPLGDPLYFSLGSPDLEHITELYGKSDDLQMDSHPPESDTELKHAQRGAHRLTHMQRHTHSNLDSPSVDRCNTSFDAVAKIRGETFFFKGLSMWRVNRGGLVSRKAVSVRKLWAALPTPLPPLRAVLERHEDHAIIFIAGSKFWLFKDLSLQDGFPRPLSDLNSAESDEEKHGVHWEPDKGVVWGSGGNREESSQVWTELIGGGVNGIITETNGSLFLFKGSHYWKFRHPGSAPEDGFPRPVASDWLNCPDPSPFHPGDISLTSIVGQEERQKSKKEGALEQIRRRDKTTTWHTEDAQDCPCFSSAAAAANTSLRFLMISMLVLLISRLYHF